MDKFESLEEMLARGTRAPAQQPDNMSHQPEGLNGFEFGAYAPQESENRESANAKVEVDPVNKVQKIDNSDAINANADVTPYAKPLFKTEYDKAMEPHGPEVKRLLPSQVSTSQVMIGGKDPDFSGYDSLLGKINTIAPKPMHWAEMLGAAIPIAVGSRYGRGAAAMGQAGKVLGDRQAELRKRDDEFQKMLLDLEAKRAAQMAKGVKGVRAKGDRTDAASAKWTDKYGQVRTSRFKDEQNQWVRDANDPVEKPSNMSIKEIEQRNGDKNVVGAQGRMVAPVGHNTYPMKQGKTANNENFYYNDKTMASTVPDGEFGDRINKTSNKLTSVADTKYSTAVKDFSKDTALIRYNQAANDLNEAKKMLAMDGAGPLLAAQRFIGMAQDKGRSLTNDEFSRMANLDTGWTDKLQQLILQTKSGKVGINALRQELEKVAAGLTFGIQDLQNERVSAYNQRIKKELGTEIRDDLLFPSVGYMTGKKQRKEADKAQRYSEELTSSRPIVVEVENKKTGERRKVKMGYNPDTGKHDRYMGDAQ
jgi:hypothetical protein